MAIDKAAIEAAYDLFDKPGFDLLGISMECAGTMAGFADQVNNDGKEKGISLDTAIIVAQLSNLGQLINVQNVLITKGLSNNVIED